MDLKLVARALARIAAKKFAASIPTNMALKVPDEVIDGLSDEQYKIFKETLEMKDYWQRPDFRWEKKQ